MENQVLDVIMNRATVRAYLDKDVPDEIIWKLARAAQQAPFTGQMYAFIYTRDRDKKEVLSKYLGRFIAGAPVFVLFCLDFRKLEKFIAYKNRKNSASDVQMLFLGIQDVSYAAMNFVLAAESLGLGTCFFGGAPMIEPLLTDMFKLPERVYPLVGMALGYPAKKPLPRPRIPTSCVLFRDEYHDLTEEEVKKALEVMDAGLIREGYYQNLNAKIPKPEGGEDDVGYDKYGWGEHISRKYARQDPSSKLRDLLRGKGIMI
ncbi:MAG: nitroreductase family protein [Candidatus Fermentithermobacillus carboniphilus]|uniref:Nitroreductase family protein n=1 Tax=Candidatus Fermentithermobacillus carboniphilus TaxID=3085328 RepID=A0AAT9LDM8_9FIRM|nr:MAG: nitroreductase family protein [Candidatus Fermentithermobacillus carboniphilus]